MGAFEQVLLGIAALAILLLFWPGVRRAVERSRRAEDRDWAGALWPVAVVVLFVIFLIMLARN